MSHSYVSQLIHCVFSTKQRRPIITPELQSRLFPYIGGIARENKMKLIAAGGMEDHVHLLISMPKTLNISKAMQLIKGGSSKWVHDTFSEHRTFEWQEGYGAFSIGIGEVERTVNYINTQEEHHREKDFKKEFISFLDLNDSLYLFGRNICLII
ncbi:MAG: IS200/IS605 family transposase [Pyrinomonadaceae bacterium]